MALAAVTAAAGAATVALTVVLARVIAADWRAHRPDQSTVKADR